MYSIFVLIFGPLFLPRSEQRAVPFKEKIAVDTAAVVDAAVLSAAVVTAAAINAASIDVTATYMTLTTVLIRSD